MTADPPAPPRHVAVVGGGITGLAAAHRLAADSPSTRVTVLEAGDRWGGKIRTSGFAGVPVDEGADNFIARVPWATALATEIGIGQRLRPPASSSAFLVRDGHLKRLPDGLVLGVPTSLGAVARSGLVSWPGLARAALDLVKGDDSPAGDETVASLVTRRLGREVDDALVGPLIGSINAGDTRYLSVNAAVPQLAEAARRSRSLIRGVVAMRRAGAARADDPLFLAPEGGMGRLVDAVVTVLAAAPSVDLRLGCPVESVEPSPCGGTTVRTAREDILVDAVVLAAPAFVAASLVRSAAPVAADLLDQVDYASVALVTVAARRDDVGHPLDGSGVLVPRRERRLLTACSFGSSKWPAWGGDGDRVVLRLSAGRHRDHRALGLDDDALVEALIGEVAPLLDWSGDVLEWRVTRWVDAFPQYAVGHQARLDTLERQLRRTLPSVALAGAGYRGLGIPACIQQGQAAARRLLEPAPQAVA